MNHTDLLNIIARKINALSYLEIGVRYGANFAKIEVPVKIGVDPDPESAATRHCTSDEFFELNEWKFDLIFIDGYHEAEQVKRDIINSWACLNIGGVIMIHDCNPEKEEHTQIPRDCKVWNGDVYKTVCEMLVYGKFTIDVDYGCCIVRKESQPFHWGNVSVDWNTFTTHSKTLLNLVTLDYGLSVIEEWT